MKQGISSMNNEYTSIDQFRKALGSGHRSNQFKVSVTLPTSYIKGDAQTNLEFICYASSIPDQSIGNIEVNFRGLVANYAGDPEKADIWTVSCYNPTSFNLRKSLIAWKRAYQEEGTTNGLDEIPLSTADVFLLGKNGNYLYQSTLYNLWPRKIGQIELSWENQNQLSTFEVDFSYDYIKDNLELANDGASNAGDTNTTTTGE